MISMSLDDFRALVRTTETQPQTTGDDSAAKKSNGMPDELGQYLDRLADPHVMEAEVKRLVEETDRIFSCAGGQ